MDPDGAGQDEEPTRGWMKLAGTCMCSGWPTILPPPPSSSSWQASSCKSHLSPSPSPWRAMRYDALLHSLYHSHGHHHGKRSLANLRDFLPNLVHALGLPTSKEEGEKGEEEEEMIHTEINLASPKGEKVAALDSSKEECKDGTHKSTSSAGSGVVLMV